MVVATIPVGDAPIGVAVAPDARSEEHTSELQSRSDLVCRLLLEKKKPQHSVYRSVFKVMSGAFFVFFSFVALALSAAWEQTKLQYKVISSKIVEENGLTVGGLGD